MAPYNNKVMVDKYMEFDPLPEGKDSVSCEQDKANENWRKIADLILNEDFVHLLKFDLKKVEDY